MQGGHHTGCAPCRVCTMQGEHHVGCAPRRVGTMQGVHHAGWAPCRVGTYKYMMKCTCDYLGGTVIVVLLFIPVV